MIDREDNVIEIDILFLLKALWHRAWIIILAAAICFAGGFFYAQKLLTPVYTASSMIYVNNSYAKINPDYAISSSELAAAQSLVDTYIIILKTPATVQEIIEKSGVNYTVEELNSMISATGEDETEIFSASVTSPDPDEAVMLANVITEVLPHRIAEVVDGSSVRTVQKATIARRSGPARRKYALLGGMLGAFIVCAWIIIRELQDDNIYDEDYINKACEDVPVLASIPDLMDTREFAKNYYYGRGYGYTKDEPDQPKKKKRNKSKKHKYYSRYGEYANLSQLEKDKLVLCEKLDFTATEAYKVMRTNLLYNLNAQGQGPKVIGITSADRREGKSTTSINLSYVMAQTNMNVLTIEGDLRLPTLAKRLDIAPGEGFTDLVNGQFESSVIAKSGKFDNWHVITSGSRTSNPSEVLGSEKVGTIMTVLKKKYDIIIVDLPPVNEVTDAMAIAPYLDAIVFVVKAQQTKKMPFNMALRQLQLAGAPLIGFVLVSSNGGGGKYDKYGRYGKYGKRYYNGKYYRRYGKYGYGKYGYGKGYGYGNGYREPYGYGYGYGYGEQPRSNGQMPKEEK